MRLYVLKLALGLLSIGSTLAPIHAFADQRLQHRVDELIRSLKSQRSPTAALDFVHWEYAYQMVDSESRERLGITTPESLKGRIKGVVSDPVAMFERRFENVARNYSPAERELLHQTFETRAQGLRAEWQKNQAQMASAGYKVGSIVVDPSNALRAHVTLIKANKDTGEPVSYEFEKDGEEWYVSADIASAGIEALQLN